MKIDIGHLIRPFMAVCFVLLTAYLAFIGKIDAKDILLITSNIMAFYFGERAALKVPGAPKPPLQ